MKNSEKETQVKVQESQTEDKTEVKQQKPKYDEMELATIFDDILFQGSYQEDLKIKGKLQVTLTTRSAEDTGFVSRKLDAQQFNLSSTFVEQRALWNLASSLISYNGKDLSSMKIEDRFVFVSKLPAHLVSALSNALVEFDLKIEQACKEGEENF